MYVLLQIISYDSPRGGVSVITEKGDVTASFLVVQHAKPSDSGTYSCAPSLGDQVAVNVHVLRGKIITILQCMKTRPKMSHISGEYIARLGTNAAQTPTPTLFGSVILLLFKALFP